jgi:molybdopterin/thiamine biosynthesis adenylyltransferase
MLKPWWERWPGRLEFELKELDKAGIPYELDQAARAAGVIALRLKPTLDGEPLNLLVVFPDIYPYTRFEVFAEDLDLEHHQHPFSKTLCLIGRATRHWKPTDTLAGFIKNRLPQVLKASRSDNPSDAADLEEHQGEPFSDYYQYVPGTIVFVDSSWSLNPEVKQGDLIIGLDENAGNIVRGVVLEIRDSNRTLLARADPSLARLYPKRMHARWLRVDAPVREVNPSRFLDTLVKHDRSLGHPLWHPVKGWRLDVIGVVFPEEVRWRQSFDGWVFVVRAEELKDKGRRRSGAYLARSGRVGREDLTTRVPELVPLRDTRVALVGLGGIGAPSAIEFARSGVGELRIVDHDIVDPGTIIRWPLGISVAGLLKTETIKNLISDHYPYTQVVAITHRVGALRGNGTTDLKILDELVDGADLVYDATAEVGIQHLLSDLARQRRLPYLCVSTTAGAWGGLVVRIRPGRTEGCWLCLQHALMDESIPSPPADPTGQTQPAGCADPTFTGASFDVGQIALAGIRLAISTLLDGKSGGYPNVDWDVAVISLRTSGGEIIAPQFDTFKLNRHPSCECGKK